MSSRVLQALRALQGFDWIQVGGGLADLLDHSGDVLLRRAVRPNLIERGESGIEITLREGAITGVAGREPVSRSLTCLQRFRQFSQRLRLVGTVLLHGLQYRDTLFVRMLYFSGLASGARH